MLHNLIKSPCRLHIVVLEVAEVDAEVGERVLELQKSLAGGTILPPFEFRSENTYRGQL